MSASSHRSALPREVIRHAILPTLVGSMLYLGWRSEELIAWEWARALGISGLGLVVRGGLEALPLSLPEWLRFSLPDALWLYALTWSVARPWARTRGVEPFAWLFFPLLLGVGAELGQAAGWVPGTFDPIDLAFCTVATALGVWVAWRGSEKAPTTAPSSASAVPRSA